jgi:hypothetical protein
MMIVDKQPNDVDRIRDNVCISIKTLCAHAHALIQAKISRSKQLPSKQTYNQTNRAADVISFQISLDAD